MGSGQGAGTGCLKIMLIFFNILFWIFGLGVLAIGIWIKVDKEIANVGEVINLGLSSGSGTDNIENIVDITAWCFIAAGIFAFIVGFFGCCGAIRESQVLLGFYIVCLVLVGCAEIGAGVYVAVRYSTLGDKISDFGSNWVKTEYDDNSVASLGFNYVQLEWCCCGYKNYLDYKGSSYVEDNTRIKDGAWMSYACCMPSETTEDSSDIQPADIEKCENAAIALAAGSNNGTSTDNIDASYQGCDAQFRAQGCEDAVIEWVQERLPIFIGVGCGVAGVQLFIFIIAVCMCVCIKREEKD